MNGPLEPRDLALRLRGQRCRFELAGNRDLAGQSGSLRELAFERERARDQEAAQIADVHELVVGKITETGRREADERRTEREAGDDRERKRSRDERTVALLLLA